MALKTFDIILDKVIDIAPSVKHFQFKYAEADVFDFIPGQFITLLIDKDDKVLRRSYSLAGAPQGSNQVEFAASYVEGGSASNLLFHLQPGDKVKASGPFGRLILPQDHYQRYVFVGTGTGITPYRSMLPSLGERIEQQQARVAILQGVRTPEELLYGEEFVDFAARYPGVAYFACYTRAQLAEPKPYERTHRVQQSFAELALNPEQDIVFLCGNPNMIDEAFVYLTELGFATARIKREKYISSN